jgi:hypothetical protein
MEADIQDDPARAAGPDELESDRPFWDSLDVEPTEELIFDESGSVVGATGALKEEP